jgi:sulfite reductase (NADPH) hemoprotein beta-component
MFKAAKEGPAKVITANDLRSGLVVFLDQEGGWTVDIAEARVLEDGADLDGAVAVANAQVAAQVVLEAYPIDVTVTDGVPVPVRLRERIRAERGPTVVYGEAERTKLTGI